jgi:hypothetical protein
MQVWLTDRGASRKSPPPINNLAWLGLAWLGLAWLGLAWLGLAWFGLAWLPVMIHTYPPMKMEPIQCSESSAYKIQTPGNYPEESILHPQHGESLKTTIFVCFLTAVPLSFNYNIHVFPDSSSSLLQLKYSCVS